MNGTENDYAFDFEIVEAAAARWQEQEAKREEIARQLADKNYTAAESKARLASYANRELQKAEESLPDDPEVTSKGLVDLLQHGEFQPEDMTDALMERVLGETRDFLTVNFLEQALDVVRCVGRIVTRLDGNRRSFGTGFMVSPRLLLTNHHVLRTADFAGRSTVEFDYQLSRQGSPLAVQEFGLEPNTFFLNDKTLDFALVAVNPLSKQQSPLRRQGWSPLIKEEGKILLGQSVNIIQHPQGRMKEVILRQNRLLHLLDGGVMAHYEADTEPGSSGSPVFNDHWEVIALHHSGVPKTNAAGQLINRDGGIWRQGDDPNRLVWVANEGIRVSRLVAFIEQATLSPRQRPLRRELLEAQPPSTESTESEAPQPIATPQPAVAVPLRSADSVQLSGGAVTLTIPLQITISLGTPQVTTPTASPTTPVDLNTDSSSLTEAVRPDPDDPEYEERPGYDRDFLGFTVPLPKLSRASRAQAAVVAGAPRSTRYELKYHHYSVMMNRVRRLAFVSAVNLDAHAPFQHAREKNDKWFFDPRLDAEIQAGNEYYQDNPLDRGHLVRRQDASWGQTAHEADLANDDTFHWTNAAPQHQIYNQATRSDLKGVLLWGNLEHHITEQAEANGGRLTVFNGPIFHKDDPEHRGLQIPREYWKVVVFESDEGDPTALAFLLSQASLIRNLPEEDFEVGPYQPFQVKIRTLAQKTKLDFGDLTDWDPLESVEDESVFESNTEAVPLTSLSDIIM